MKTDQGTGCCDVNINEFLPKSSLLLDTTTWAVQ